MLPSNQDPPSIRARIESLFERWAGFVARHPRAILAACLLTVAVLTPQARHIVADTHPEKFLSESHPVRAAYSVFKKQFGSDNFVLITVEHDAIFSLDFVEWLRGLHDDLEDQVPHLADITSLLNARSTRGEGDELVVEDLMEDWPSDDLALARMREIVRSTPSHQRTVIGDGERHTSILLELDAYVFDESGQDAFSGFDSGESRQLDGAPIERSEPKRLSGHEEMALVRVVDRVIEDHRRPDMEISRAGLPVLNMSIVESMADNLARFMLLSVVIMLIVLTLLFRRRAGVFLPFVVIVPALLCTLGFVGLRGEPINMTAQILPSLLQAVGASAAIHLLVLFFQGYDAGSSPAEALRRALGHAGLPVTMACATTAAGLASFLGADLMTVRDIGTIAPVGILFVLLFTLTLLPALLVLAPISRRDPEARSASNVTGKMIARAGDWTVRHPKSVLAATAAIVSFGVMGVARVEFENDGMRFIARGDPLHESTRVADRVMGGSTSMELIIDTGRENGLYDPDFQRRLDLFAEELIGFDTDFEVIRKTSSVNDVLKEIHQALNRNERAYYVTPDDRDLIAQELLLFENSGNDDLESLVDSQFRMARLSLRSVWGGASFYVDRIARIEKAAKEAFPTETVWSTGVLPILMTAMNETEEGLISSYLIALLTITPMMMMLVGTLRGGLASMVPNLAPVIVVLGLMGWFGLPLDNFGAMTGSIAIGLAVDDTIHFFHTFYREFGRTGDTRASVRRTLETTGRALLTTSIVLSVAFFVFVFASIPAISIFGAVTTLAIALAFAADVLISPALVTLATRNRQAEGVPPLL